MRRVSGFRNWCAASQDLEERLAESELKGEALQTSLDEREEELEAVVGDKQANIKSNYIYKQAKIKDY